MSYFTKQSVLDRVQKSLSFILSLMMVFQAFGPGLFALQIAYAQEAPDQQPTEQSETTESETEELKEEKQSTPDPVLGCMDKEAENFNADATQDDDSCQYAKSLGEVLEATVEMNLPQLPLRKTANDNQNNAVGGPPEKIDICHSTGSDQNPYNPQSPNESADVSGHDGHDGPVWFSGIQGDWGDIIPPFEYDGGSYPGKNWTTEGQAIYNNDCATPKGPPSPPANLTGVIEVCKIVLDHEGNDVTGTIGTTFTIPWLEDADYEGPATQDPDLQGDVVFTTPLTLQTVFGNEQGQCRTYDNLSPGKYYYGEEGISPDNNANWEIPLYHDDYKGVVDSYDDLKPFNSNLDAQYDNHDGVINLGAGETRTLIVINQMKESQQPTECTPVELIKNGSFEDPEVNDPAQWDIFTSGLEWLVEWMNPAGAPNTASLELHEGVLGAAAHGDQYAELDGDWYGPNDPTTGEAASTLIYQDISTVPGEGYMLKFSFKPRPDANTDAENALGIVWGGDNIDTITGSDTSGDWKEFFYPVFATSSVTRVQFEDRGTSNSLGTFLDNVSLKCDDGSSSGDASLELGKTGVDNGDGTVTFTINWSVIGGDVEDVVITDEIPAGTTFISASDSGATTSPTTVEWNLGNKNAGTNGFVTLTVGIYAPTDMWASSVKSVAQGLQKGGIPVIAERSDELKTLGPAQNNDTINFFSLGFGGNIVLEFASNFVDGAGDDIVVTETSYDSPSDANYPEDVELFISQTGLDGSWVSLGHGIQDEGFDMNGFLPWARYVKLVDVSNINSAKFPSGTVEDPDGADGYDVDGVKVNYPVGDTCRVPNTASISGLFNQNTITDSASTVVDIDSGLCDEEPLPDLSTVTMCKVDEVGNKLSDWQLMLLGAHQGNYAVSGATGATTTTAELGAGDYVLLAEGEYTYRATAGAEYSDAAYSKRDPGDAVYGGIFAPWVRVNDFLAPHTGWLGIKVNGAFTDWGNMFNEGHVYAHGLTLGASSTLDLSIWDDNYSDNSGSLSVDIYNGYTGVTDKFGCVTFTDVPYGSYWADEILQDGWEIVDGVGEVEVNDEFEVFTIVNREEDTAPIETETFATTTVFSSDLAGDIFDVISSPTKWFFYNDQTGSVDGAEGINNTIGSFVFGPSTAPLGAGSVEMSSPVEIPGPLNARRNLATYQYKDIQLSDITAIRFSTYSQSTGNGSPASERSAYLHFNVDFYNTDTWQKRLIYLPATNGVVVNDTWQTWDALDSGNALWAWSGFVANGNQWPDGNTNPNRTWNDIKVAFPNAETRSTDSFFGFRIGEPYADGFTGNIDNVVFGYKNNPTNTHTETYDFEPTEPEGRFTLTVTVIGDGTGEVNGADLGGIENCNNRAGEEVQTCQQTYPVGTVVDLTATPDEGSNFNNSWAVGAGTCTGNNTPCQVTMNSNIDLTAHFDLNDNNNNGGGGGGSSSNNNSSRSGQRVLGASDDDLIGEVAGATTDLPGLPNTGNGEGTGASMALLALILAFAGINVVGLRTLRKN